MNNDPVERTGKGNNNNNIKIFLQSISFTNTTNKEWVASANTVFYTLIRFFISWRERKKVKECWNSAGYSVKTCQNLYYLNFPWRNENYVILSLTSSINLPERQRAFEKANFSRMASSKSSSAFNLISPLWSFDCPLRKGKNRKYFLFWKCHLQSF